MSLSSDEINLLIQHYLQEFGYDHAAFAFGAESKIPTKKVASRYVPPGSLVYLIQKGIMLSQIEKHADDTLASPSNLMNNEISKIKASMHKSGEMNRDAATATRVLRLRPNSEKDEFVHYYLDRKCALFLEGHNKPAIYSCWTKSSNLLATGSADGNVIIWNFDIDNGYVYDNPIVLRPGGNPPDITALCWFSQEQILAVGTFSGVIILYSLKNVSNTTLSLPNSSSNSNISSIGAMKGWQANSYEIARFSEHDGKPIVSLHFARKINLLAAASVDGQITISENGIVKYKWKIDGPVTDIRFYSRTSLFVSGNRTVYILSTERENSTEKVFETKGEITQITISQTGRYLAVGDEFGNFAIIDKHRKVICSHNRLHDSSICLISAAVKTDSFVVGGCDGFVKIIDVKQHSEPIVFDGHARTAYLVAYDPQERFVASVGADRTMSIWSLETPGRALFKFSLEVPVCHLAFSPSGRFLSACLRSGQVAIIDFGGEQ
ncbi:hypothetical protein TRFO_31406 [Tritrichomonas foetus]|uniref:Uncharacterized protein n=1 Tax=Tritrichomonas foetus TaxID=1144522 RepID=A0A1J4JTF3_9EUKA|nr:hypothetical protein TRFO_31406 [Tritrichomonas foetus]|eukprot:OHT01704.1 hypothetical protein TRFO_31406 [Tritrichomonas foetus]